MVLPFHLNHICITRNAFDDTFYCLFQRSYRPFEAWKSLVLRSRPETATSLLWIIRNHLKIAWSKSENNPSLKNWNLDCFLCSQDQRSFPCFSSRKYSFAFPTLKQLLIWTHHLLLPSVLCIYFMFNFSTYIQLLKGTSRNKWKKKLSASQSPLYISKTFHSFVFP